MKTMEELLELWEDFGDCPVDEDDNIEVDFLHFPSGTDRFDIWHWFEEQNEDFIIGKILNG